MLPFGVAAGMECQYLVVEYCPAPGTKNRLLAARHGYFRGHGFSSLYQRDWFLMLHGLVMCSFVFFLSVCFKIWASDTASVFRESKVV